MKNTDIMERYAIATHSALTAANHVEMLSAESDNYDENEALEKALSHLQIALTLLGKAKREAK